MLLGTSGDDIICGLGGDDRIVAGSTRAELVPSDASMVTSVQYSRCSNEFVVQLEQ
ncbi:MAG: hypothetical protein ACKOOG_04420 [Actinomycetota bacterium]